jgi:predicted XRE-type DNA-binding protein
MFTLDDCITPAAYSEKARYKRGGNPTTGKFKTREELVGYVCRHLATTHLAQREIGERAKCSQATVSFIKHNEYIDWKKEKKKNEATDKL